MANKSKAKDKVENPEAHFAKPKSPSRKFMKDYRAF